MLKAIFHIDEMPKWSLLLKNVRNLLDATDTNLQVEVLANAEAVKFYALSDSFPDGEAMRELFNKGVLFVACNNALNNLGLTRERLFPFVKIVPAGVLELIEKQSEGFAYIKP